MRFVFLQPWAIILCAAKLAPLREILGWIDGTTVGGPMPGVTANECGCASHWLQVLVNDWQAKHSWIATEHRALRRAGLPGHLLSHAAYRMPSRGERELIRSAHIFLQINAVTQG